MQRGEVRPLRAVLRDGNAKGKSPSPKVPSATSWGRTLRFMKILPLNMCCEAHGHYSLFPRYLAYMLVQARSSTMRVSDIVGTFLSGHSTSPRSGRPQTLYATPPSANPPKPDEEVRSEKPTLLCTVPFHAKILSSCLIDGIPRAQPAQSKTVELELPTGRPRKRHPIPEPSRWRWTVPWFSFFQLLNSGECNPPREWLYKGFTSLAK